MSQKGIGVGVGVKVGVGVAVGVVVGGDVGVRVGSGVWVGVDVGSGVGAAVGMIQPETMVKIKPKDKSPDFRCSLVSCILVAQRFRQYRVCRCLAHLA